MKMSFRWYGESDPISLEYISQIPGMHSIVSAVYDVKPGEVWPEESLAKMKKQCEEHGLVFDVVESIPVHEDIKLGRNNVDELLEVYCENIRRCAKYGVKCVTYNFMPVFDWTRTQLDKKAPDGSTSLVMYWDQMKGLDPLKDDIHLPGWDSSYTQDEVRELINAYGEIGEEGLWKNLEKFLKKVIPVAEECGVVMAIHPDDPPSVSYTHLDVYKRQTMLSILFASSWSFTYVDTLTQGGPLNSTINAYYFMWDKGFRTSSSGLTSSSAVVFFLGFGLIALVLSHLGQKLSYYDN